MKIKTIDINAKQWFDKVNGNSYFSAIVDINYKLSDWIVLKLPFQYGYGEHYKNMCFKEICKELDLTTSHNLWSFCDDHNIILRANIQTGCLKREVLAHGN